MADPTTSDDLPAGTMVGEYRVEQKLGQGGMGSVWGARHPLIGKRAAIKVIKRELSVDREAVERFVLEAQAVNQIGHPNIVDVFSFGVLPDGRSYFVMEWLAGKSLASRMRSPVPLGEAVAIVDPIARALEAAHDAGVIHRDLKPDNVFLVSVRDEPARVKLLDFGLAKLSTDSGGIGRTRTGIVMGTPLYVSPEQARGARIDARTDVYSLGVILYELVTGTAPFVADSAVEIMAKHIFEPPPPARSRHPGLAPELEWLVDAMLAKDAAQRPALPAVRAALAPFAHSTDAPARWEPAAVWLASDPASVARSAPVSAPISRAEAPRTTHLSTHPAAIMAAVTPPPEVPRTDREPAVTKCASHRSGRALTIAVAAVSVVVVAGIAWTLVRPDVRSPDSAGSPAARPSDAPASPTTAAEERSAGSVDAGPSAANVAVDAATRASDARADVASGVLELRVDPGRARVTVDGAAVALEDGRARVDLAPGEHVIVVRSPRRVTETRRVEVAAGGSLAISIRLERVAPKRDPKQPRVDVDAVHDPFAP